MASVILVEDEQMLLQSLRRHFPWEDCGVAEVHTASGGREALDLFRRHGADVLITDIQMPDMNGLALARTVRALDPSVSLVFISAYSDVAYLKEAISLNAAEYLFKPIDHGELRRVLRNVLAAREIKERHIESRHMVNAYTDALKLPVLSSLLMRRADPQALEVQMDLVGLRGEGAGDGCWSVMFSPDAEVFGRQHMENQARQLLGDRLAESFFVTLEGSFCALVLRLTVRPEALGDTLRLPETGDSSWMPVVDSLSRLFGMGSEYIRQQTQQRPEGQSSLANTPALYKRITEYIDGHYMEPDLSASSIAEALHYTVSYVCTAFRREGDQTIHGYINRVRLDQACRLLQTTRMPVRNVSELTGYENEAYFSRVFKKEIGVTPREYRKQAKRGGGP